MKNETANDSKPLVWNGRIGAWEDSDASEQRQGEALAKPFDARTEVSADAQYISGRIVKHLWIIFVLLPVMLVLLFEILTK